MTAERKARVWARLDWRLFFSRYLQACAHSINETEAPGLKLGASRQSDCCRDQRRGLRAQLHRQPGVCPARRARAARSIALLEPNLQDRQQPHRRARWRLRPALGLLEFVRPPSHRRAVQGIAALQQLRGEPGARRPDQQQRPYPGHHRQRHLVLGATGAEQVFGGRYQPAAARAKRGRYRRQRQFRSLQRAAALQLQQPGREQLPGGECGRPAPGRIPAGFGTAARSESGGVWFPSVRKL